MKSYRVRVAVAVAVAGVALSACGGPMHAGAAAIVGKDRISASELDAEVQAFRRDLAAKNIKEDQFNMDLLPQMILLNLAEARQLIEYGRQKGITVTPREIQDVIDARGGKEQMDNLLLSSGIPLRLGPTILRASVVHQKLMVQIGAGQDAASRQKAQEQISQEAQAAVPIKYSPRYGKRDPQRGFVADDRFGAVPTGS